MKVLFVHQYLGALGGAEADVVRSARGLASRGHSASLLYSQRTGRGEEEWCRAFSECTAVSHPDGAEEALREFAPDVVYFHNLPGWEILERLLSCGVPVVRKLHDHQMYCLRGCKYNYFTRRVCRQAASFRCVFPCLGFLRREPGRSLPLAWASYRAKRKELAVNRRCDCLVVYSRYQEEELLRNGFDGSRIVVHPPVQVWETEAEESSFSGRNLVLFAGQLLRGKGVDLLLRALARVRVPFECEILGDGNHRGYCERLSRRLRLQDRVRFRGFVGRNEMDTLYREASAVAFTSVWPEPFGMVGREAMHHGLPVVAFDAGAVREWLRDGETGFVVPWKDVKAFAARLQALLSDKELARAMGRRGREEMKALSHASQGKNPVEETLLGVIEAAGKSIPCPAANAARRGEGALPLPAGASARLAPVTTLLNGSVAPALETEEACAALAANTFEFKNPNQVSCL